MTYDDISEEIANAISDRISVLTTRYLDRPDQAATTEENAYLSDLIERFRDLTEGWPGIDEVLHFHETRYNLIHTK